MIRSKVLNDELNLYSETKEFVDIVSDSVFMVTGATGLLGSMFIKYLIAYSRSNGINTHIVAIVRNMDRVDYVFDSQEKECIEFIKCDLSKDEKLVYESGVDYILHAAAVTSSKEMVTNPVDNIKTSVTGTVKVLEFAKENGVKKVVYLSSMEVYGQMTVTDHKIEENELGYIDIHSPRSCYPEGKRMCECICNSYHTQYGTNVVCARLAQAFGPGVLPRDNRVFSQFAKSVMEEKNIVLKTKGQSEGNYVYILDAITGIMVLFKNGVSGEAYNVTNEANHMTISAMADMVARELSQNRIKVVYDIDDSNKMYAADTKMHLSSEKIMRLGWQPKVQLIDMYRKLISYYKEV